MKECHGCQGCQILCGGKGVLTRDIDRKMNKIDSILVKLVTCDLGKVTSW